MLVIETLKCKISDFLNSNMCFCSRLYCTYLEGSLLIGPTINLVPFDPFFVQNYKNFKEVGIFSQRI